MARFIPILTPDLPELRSASARVRGNASPCAKPARRNPVGKTKRGRRGGWVAKSGTGKFEHVRVRPPGHFVSGSLRTVPWDFITNAAERHFVLRTHGLRNLSIPAGTKVLTGRLKATVKAGRVPGVRVKWLATGVQAVLLPVGYRANPRPASKPRPVRRRRSAQKVRRNPARLVILNPATLPAGPIAEMAKALRIPKERALFLRTFQQASSAERAKMVDAIRTYKGFHHVWPPRFSVHGQAPGKQNRFLVGLGKADHVGYRADKAFPGSSKQGAPWRHHFSSGQVLVTNENGKGGLGILDRPGARRGTEVTDFIRR